MESGHKRRGEGRGGDEGRRGEERRGEGRKSGMRGRVISLLSNAFY